jgi:methyl-accepting chemotaxis protein
MPSSHMLRRGNREDAGIRTRANLMVGAGSAATAVPWLLASFWVPIPIGVALGGAALTLALAAPFAVLAARVLHAPALAAQEELAELRAREADRALFAKKRLDGVAIRIEALEPLRENAADFAMTQLKAMQELASSITVVSGQTEGIHHSAEELRGTVHESSTAATQMSAVGVQLIAASASLHDQVNTIASSIAEAAASTRHVGASAVTLAASSQDASASIDRMAISMRQVDLNASEAARLGDEVAAAAELGNAKVHETITGMEGIREVTAMAQEVIQRLGRRTDEIGTVTDVIDHVADETSLLALNAAIIAAQAGERGRAFAVVAGEIGALADRVAKSTKEIASLIRSVQEEVGNAVSAIDKGTQRVAGGVRLSAEAGASLEQILATTRESGQRVREIVRAVKEQAFASQQVAKVIQSVRDHAKQIRLATEEQTRGNDLVLERTEATRVVAYQLHQAVDEHAKGAKVIAASIERVSNAAERIETSLREQSQGCETAVAVTSRVYERARSAGGAGQQMSDALEALRVASAALGISLDA